LQQQDVFQVVSLREARPSDSEVLTMRLVDRVRPLFPDDYHAEVQVIQLMSYDEDVMPDALQV
jgi:polyribonucleotide nucleotidyltransferase